MPITPTYPGVYIEELPSMSHSVTPAPTSVTVFIGYSHPLKTNPSTFGTAEHIFNFTDYQGYFGGYFDLGEWLPDYLGNAVFQYFQNGGTEAWVIGLETSGFLDPSGNPLNIKLTPATLMVDMSAAGAAANTITVTLTALEPGGTDPANPNTPSGTVTQVQFLNRRQSDSTTGNYDIADIIIRHGPSIQETYRGVAAKDIVTALAPSSLVSAAIDQAGETPAQFPDPLPNSGDLAYAQVPPANSTLFNPADYSNPNYDVFASGGSLDVDVKIFNLMVLPGISPVNEVQSAVLSQALVFCEEKRAFFIMDAPPNATVSGVGPQPAGPPAPVTMDAFWNGSTPPPVSTNGAIYFPYLQTINPVTTQPMNSPPSGFVAGIYAAEDVAYSVGKAPAGLETTIQGAPGGVVPWGRMTDQQQGPLNGDGVNCLREFPGLGPPVVFGARTLVSSNPAFQEWKYVPVRRTALFLEQSLYMSLGWAVFQPNDTPLWNALTLEIEAFMLTLFRQGNYFQGNTPTDAFLVKCDSTTTTPTDQANGVVNILVGFAPLKPAEFVVIMISQLAGQTQT
jgi:uncharacterized protein